MEVIETTIAESGLVGLFSRANSNGIILSNLATSAEVERLKKAATGINVEVLESPINAIREHHTGQ